MGMKRRKHSSSNNDQREVLMATLIKEVIELHKAGCKHLIVVLDEIDAFAHHKINQQELNVFLKSLLNANKISMTLIGIANSIEFFKGELQSKATQFHSSMLCKNELKLIFAPYSKDQIVTILSNLASNFIDIRYSQYKREAMNDLISKKTFELIALKVEKLSGDLRLALDIMQKAIASKLTQLRGGKDS